MDWHVMTHDAYFIFVIAICFFFFGFRIGLSPICRLELYGDRGCIEGSGLYPRTGSCFYLSLLRARVHLHSRRKRVEKGTATEGLEWTDGRTEWDIGLLAVL